KTDNVQTINTPYGMERIRRIDVWEDRLDKINNIPGCLPGSTFVYSEHKLKTQDRVYVWDVSNTLGSTCSLCEATPDSHEYLFFMCPFSTDVWDHMKKLAGLDRVVYDVYAIIHHIGPKAKRRSSHIVIAKLSAVQLKLLSCSFKRSSEGVRYARMWDLPILSLNVRMVVSSGTEIAVAFHGIVFGAHIIRYSFGMTPL
ncbi:hypothetical protein Tco_1141387, partial [Tanacetum coccineum]